MLIPRMCDWYGVRKYIKILFYRVMSIGNEDIDLNATLFKYFKRPLKIDDLFP